MNLEKLRKDNKYKTLFSPKKLNNYLTELKILNLSDQVCLIVWYLIKNKTRLTTSIITNIKTNILLKYRIQFKDILTFLEIDYRDVSLIILYLVVIGFFVSKNQMNRI